MIHQDSGVSPHVENYASLPYVQAFDFGQDTDFETLGRLRPDAEVNCILFPSWIATHSAGRHPRGAMPADADRIALP